MSLRYYLALYLSLFFFPLHKVLAGDEEGLRGVGSGKVLKSGPKDRVFINMVDHGAPGIFAFPNEYLNATDLIDAVLNLHNNKKFHQVRWDD